MSIITVKAKAINDNKNGTFSIELEDKPLTQEQNKLLESLFPDVLDGAYALLNKQALLSAIASQSEVMAIPSKETEVRPMKKKSDYLNNPAN